MGQQEKEIINKRLTQQTSDERLFRANAGKAWAGTVVSSPTEKVKIAKEILSTNGRFTRAVILKSARCFHGLPKGFSDLFGLESITITEDMIGKRIAVFVAEECKTGDLQLTDEQQLFGEMVERMGGKFVVNRD